MAVSGVAIRKVLVANRGEIARRVMRTCRAMGIGTVAVYSDPDTGAPFVADADEAVRLPGATPAQTYLRAEALLAAAAATGADAVHPGYGFLSENAGFARACQAAGLVWVGPPPDAIAAMGDKLAAKALMAAAGVPVLPTYDAEAAPPDGAFPVLVKAAFGGGGRGMRIVREPAALAGEVERARREAESAFGAGTVFLERYVEAPRHVEIQVFGDAHGGVVSLHERECSIQRRYQKIVEESPSPAVDEPLRSRMGEAAVAAARAIGYVGAGTVEFLLAPDGGFFFLEMNTRLQVEHPVTECVTGLDLVRLQLLVAAGEPLPAAALAPRLSGAAIEVRLYAEDAAAGFLPKTGTLSAFDLDAPGVRVDSGVEAGSVVGMHYDPMLAKVISHAPTRSEAAARLAAALAGARIHGVTTNRDLLVRVLREAEFLAGGTDTAYLDRHPDVFDPLADHDTERLHALAAALAGQAARRARAPVQRGLPSGWRNNPSQPQVTSYDGAHGRQEVRYSFGRAGLRVENLDGVRLLAASAEEVDLAVGGVRRRYRVRRDGATVYVDSPLGASTLTEVDRLPIAADALAAGSLVAPMPGTVVRVEVAAGARVRAGEMLVVVEAMKMEHAVTSPADGVVADLLVAAGEQVDAGRVLVRIEAATGEER